MPNGFVTKSSAPASSAATLSASRSLTDRTTIGTSVQPRRPRDHLEPVHAGQAEVEDHGVRPVTLRKREGSLPGSREVDRVAARPEVRRERAEDLRLVVDDKDPSHGAVRSRGSSSARHPGCPRPRRCRPSPRRSRAPPRGRAPRLRLRAVAEPLERHEHAVALVPRHPWAAVDDAKVDAAVHRACDDPDRSALARGPARSRRRLRSPAQQPGVGDDTRQRLGDVHVDRVCAGADARERGRDDLVEADRRRRDLERARLQRLMSSRFPTSPSSRSVSASIVWRNASRSSRDQSISSPSRDVTDALIPASGVRRSCDTAERIASRRSLTRSRSSTSEASASSSSMRIDPASSLTNASRSRRSSSGTAGPTSASTWLPSTRCAASLRSAWTPTSASAVQSRSSPVPQRDTVERERRRIDSRISTTVDVPASRASVSASARAR